MSSNRGVVYKGPKNLEVDNINFPKLELRKRKCEHGVILKNVATNICGSDQHIFRGRFTVPEGTILGHEITGEVIEVGRDVEFLNYQVISLDKAPQAYQEFDSRAPKKFIIDPHNSIAV